MLKTKIIGIFLVIILCLNATLPAISLAVNEVEENINKVEQENIATNTTENNNVVEEEYNNKEENTEETTNNQENIVQQQVTQNNIEQKETIVEPEAKEEATNNTVTSSSNSHIPPELNVTTNELGVAYYSHVQDYGWETEWALNGKTSGTTGKNKKVEAVEIKLVNAPKGSSIKYKAYVENIGWQDITQNGEIIGTTGENLKMEAIRISLEGLEDYSVEYRVHLQDLDWQDWVTDGEIAGFVGEGIKIEAIEIKLTEKKQKDNLGIQYRSHVQDKGWEETYVQNGTTSGTTGKNKKVEATQMQLVNASSAEQSVKYRLYIEGQGWQDWTYDGQIAGTIGKNKKVFGIRVELENAEGYTVKYRAHIQDLGWTEWVENGQTAGNIYKTKKIEAIEVTIIPDKEKENNIYVEYYSHIQDKGWEEEFLFQDEETSGTTGQNKKVEAVKMRLVNAPEDLKIKYRAYVQDQGWQDWAYDGEISGTTGDNKKIYGIRVELEGLEDYSIQYKAHIQDEGWSGWKTDGVTAGDILKNKKIEAIMVRIVPKTQSSVPVVQYSSYVQDKGWEEEFLFQNGEMSGTVDQNKRIESIKLNIINRPVDGQIKYKVHIEDIGWTDWYESGQEAGEAGSGKKIEAIQIKLENMPEYTVEYQTHIQDEGWQDWRQDGKSSGTTGRNLKIEAIRVQIVGKYKSEFNGIDVSSWQFDIDYATLTSKNNLDFIIMRAGYGRNDYQKDVQFEDNYAQAKAYGIPAGVYLYSYATDVAGAQAEAYNMLNWIKGKSFDLPVFYDIEDPTQSGLGKETITAMCEAFCKIISDAGYQTGIYSSKNFIQNNIDFKKIPLEDSLWVAAYGNKTDGTMPDESYKYPEYHDIWQYSSSGSLAGISTRVDMNICYNTSYFER